MNSNLSINKQPWTSHLQGQILQGKETHVVVVEVAPPLNQAVVLHLAINGILEDGGVAMALPLPF